MPTATTLFERPQLTNYGSAHDRAQQALREGGMLKLAVTSKASGRRLEVLFTCRRRENGKVIPRSRLVGRVGCQQATHVAAEVVGRPDMDPFIGTYWIERDFWTTPEFAAHDDLDHYMWAAHRGLAWAVSGEDTAARRNFEQAVEVIVANECSACGRPLITEEDLARGMGSECSTHPAFRRDSD